MQEPEENKEYKLITGKTGKGIGNGLLPVFLSNRDRDPREHGPGKSVIS